MEERYAVVTGATQGIGKAVVQRLLQEGFHIAICARTRADLERAEGVWRAEYPQAKIIVRQADLADREQVRQFGDVVLQEFPQVDILVNNAGLFFPGKLADEPEGHLETLMSVNVYSAYHLTRKLLPAMKARRSGHIFNLCSVASLQAYENGGAYSITKYALLGFTENLRHELRPEGVKVTALMPGATWSRSWEGSGLPEGRMMKAEDVANMIWAAYTVSASASVESIVMRPLAGDI